MNDESGTVKPLSGPRVVPTRSASAPQSLPSRIKLLSWGVNPSTDGDVIVDDRTLAAFSAMQKKIGRERAPLDYEHNTVPGTPEYERTKEPRVIAAMGTPIVIKGEGLFLEALSYTATGQASAAARDYEDVSAAPLLNKDRVVVGLHSAALTRAGAVYGAHFSATDILKLAGEGITIGAFSARLDLNIPALQNSNTPSKPMTELTLEALSAEIAKAIRPLTERLATLEAAKPPVVDLTPLSARLDKIEAANTTAAAAALDAEKARIVPLFAAEGRTPINPVTGKAYTADELNALDIPTLKVLHANTPKTVPLSATSKTAGTDGKNDLKGLAKAIAAHKSDCAK
jgi:hypothetical protein